MSDRKVDRLLDALREGWVNAQDLCFMLAWQPHTLRGAISRLNTISANSGNGKAIERRRENGVTSYRAAQ
jgi:hypothetical protein